jgi:hypothetical protein
MGQTDGSVETVYEDDRHLLLNQLEKSAVAEHNVELDHLIRFQESEVLLEKQRGNDPTEKGMNPQQQIIRLLSTYGRKIP